MTIKIKRQNYIGLGLLTIGLTLPNSAQALNLRGSFNWQEEVLGQFGTAIFSVNQKDNNIGSIDFLVDSPPDPNLTFVTNALFSFNTDDTISGIQFSDVVVQTQEGGLVILNDVVLSIDSNLGTGLGTLLITDTNLGIENVPDMLSLTNFQSQVVSESSNPLLFIILGFATITKLKHIRE